jgi:hypothetical protein
VRRFVIEGFSGANADGRVPVPFCGSEGGAANPLPMRFSALGTAMPFCDVDACDCGDPTADDVWDAGGETCGFSAIKPEESRGALTVAMMLMFAGS